MNIGAFGENFPYSNFHDLNMDWIIKIAKDFLDQYTHIQQVIADGEQSLQDITESGLAQLDEKADNLEQLLQEWYNTHSEDIANELADALNDIQDALNTSISSLNSTAATVLSEFYTNIAIKAAETIASIPEDYTTLSNKINSLGSANSVNNTDGYPGYFRFPMTTYDSTWHFFEFKCYGFNTEIIIDTKGNGVLQERINNINYDRINNMPMILYGDKTFRVYTEDTTIIPDIYLKTGCFIGGYFTYSNNVWTFIKGNVNRTVYVIDVDKNNPIDIEADSDVTFDLELVTANNESISLDTRDKHYYTLNEGRYIMTIMTANHAGQIYPSTLKKFHITPVVFPKMDKEQFYEELKCKIDTYGAQGICCDEEYVYQFTGLGNVFKYNFSGELIDTTEISRDYGHCNSATYYDNKIYLVDSNESKVVIINKDYSLIGIKEITNIASLTYGKDGFFYGIKITSEDQSHFATGVSLYRYNLSLENETLVQSNIVPDTKYIIQGMEIKGNELVCCMLNQNYYGILACFSKSGQLNKWRYVQLSNELEDIAINSNGQMYFSYQGNQNENLPIIMTMGRSIIEYNASTNSTNVLAGVSLGRVNDPLMIYADADHAIINGTLYGNTIGVGNIARITSNIVPHYIYKAMNYNINGSSLITSGTTARNNKNFPLFSVSSSDSPTIPFKNFVINLKNNRWFTEAL